jgi:transposase InsO family protein
MSDTRTYTIPELTSLLESLEGTSFKADNKAETYDWIEGQLYRYKYDRLGRTYKGVVRAFLRKYTGYSDSQLTRLITKWRTTHHVKLVSYTRHRFHTIYTRDDILLLAKVDTAHNLLAGPATKHILEREYDVFGHMEYVRLKDISVAHLYNLRHTFCYRDHAQVFIHTRAVKNTLGERRKPRPDGRPGFLRVDSVHQGDSPDGKKGCYHINFVDEVTQWELVACVETISERHMRPILEALLAQFPFMVINFHSDNGSEYINGIVAALLNKLFIHQTKSRPRRHTDNGLVETKNGSIIRKHIEYGYIPANKAPLIDKWYQDWLNTYLNFHRPCGFATVERDKKGKEKLVYKTEDYQTPYEKFRSLPEAQRYLRAGVTFANLDKIAYAMSDTEYATAMDKARGTLSQELKHSV